MIVCCIFSFLCFLIVSTSSFEKTMYLVHALNNNKRNHYEIKSNLKCSGNVYGSMYGVELVCCCYFSSIYGDIWIQFSFRIIWLYRKTFWSIKGITLHGSKMALLKVSALWAEFFPAPSLPNCNPPMKSALQGFQYSRLTNQLNHVYQCTLRTRVLDHYSETKDFIILQVFLSLLSWYFGLFQINFGYFQLRQSPQLYCENTLVGFLHVKGFQHNFAA